MKNHRFELFARGYLNVDVVAHGVTISRPLIEQAISEMLIQHRVTPKNADKWKFCWPGEKNEDYNNICSIITVPDTITIL